MSATTATAKTAAEKSSTAVRRTPCGFGAGSSFDLEPRSATRSADARSSLVRRRASSSKSFVPLMLNDPPIAATTQLAADGQDAVGFRLFEASNRGALPPHWY